MLILFLLLCRTHYTIPLKCYDCIDCSYPWSSFGIETYGSIFNIFSPVQSCYKKEFYNAIDRRLDRVARGALNRDCRAGKFETIDERSVTYCCYSNYCNGTRTRQLRNDIIVNIITLLIHIIFVVKE